LLSQAKEQEQKLLAYLKLTPIDLWNTDLDEFLEEWEAMMEADIAAEAGMKPRKKGTTLKTRKSLVRKNKGDYGDTDDEDFGGGKPKKAAASKRDDDGGAKARNAASKAKIAAAAAVFATSDDDDEPKRNRIPLKTAPSEPSDTEMRLPPKPKAVSKPPPKEAPNPAAKRKR
jgi:DNA topoisomerase-2